MRGRPPRWDSDRSPSLIALVELFNKPIPDIPGIPRPLTDVLRYGMANDPGSRPTAEQLRDMLAELDLRPRGPARPPGAGEAPRGVEETPTVITPGPRRAKRRWPFS